MQFKSINPYNGKVIGTYFQQSEHDILDIVHKSDDAFNSWSRVPLEHRTKLIANAALVLKDNIEDYATMITREMGKPIFESRAEINKCAWVCDYYAEYASKFLADEKIETDAQLSFVRHDPLGTILAIMPWNFPYWQVFRFAAPTLTAGNTGLLKHAPNVFGCASQIANVFVEAGFPKGVFQNLTISHQQVHQVIAHDAIKAITLTGSERAGMAVAETAGKYLKKCVLELGGNNAFIVWKDADINKSVNTALTARMLNNGQSCIAAKRFILVEEIYDEFVDKFLHAIKKLKTGDPLAERTQLGPLARKDLADHLNDQIKKSINLGASLLLGGDQSGCFHAPTVLGDVKPGMPAFEEETFGPLAAMIKAKDEVHAFDLSEQSKYGLGVTVCTTDFEKAIKAAQQVSDGAYFINEFVKSDPRLPFGGTKRSGYGRELAQDGIFEFINRKTVYVK